MSLDKRRFHFISSEDNDGYIDFGVDDVQGDTTITCPTKKIIELIGIEGVQIIDEKLKQMVKWKKIIYGGSERAGFKAGVEFADLEKKIIISVGNTIENIENTGELDLVIPEKYKKNNYALLYETLHYIISVKQILSEIDFNAYLRKTKNTPLFFKSMKDYFKENNIKF